MGKQPKTKEELKAIERDVICLCGCKMVLRTTPKFTYPNSGRPRLFYGCSNWPNCDGVIGAHPSGEPLGFVVDKETQAMRGEVHKILEKKFPIDKEKQSRWLRNHGFGNGHCGQMDRAACEKCLARLNS